MLKEAVVGIGSALAQSDLLTVVFANANFAFVDDPDVGGFGFGAESGYTHVGRLVFDF